MKLIATLAAVAALSTAAAAQNVGAPPKIPTGIQVAGSTNYVVVQGRVVQIDCKKIEAVDDRRVQAACYRGTPGPATTDEK